MSQKLDQKAVKHLAENRGRRAEFLAGLWFMAKGYQLLERRYRCHSGEIDLIARKKQYIHFVEVKYRPTLRQGKESVSFAQLQRLRRAADHWLSSKPALTSFNAQLDLIILCPFRLPKHFKNYWHFT